MYGAMSVPGKTRRIFGIIGILTILLIIFIYYLSRAIQNMLLPVVDYENPKKGYLEEKITMDGKVSIYDLQNVTSLESYKILGICVKVGDNVKQGDILLEYDIDENKIEIKKKNYRYDNCY